MHEAPEREPPGRHWRIQGNVLLLVLGSGAMAVPFIGALRESVQRQAGISRAEFGLWVFVLGLVGGVIGLALSVVMRRTLRTTFIRIGAWGMFIACVLLAVAEPAPGWALAPLVLGWLILRTAHPLTGSGNGIFADLWDHSPHTGIILLHSVNAFGKVAAPLAVLAFGTAVRPTALLFAGMFGLLAVESVFWPRQSLDYLSRLERSRDVKRRLRLPSNPWVWLCVVQFAFIGGAEGGATSIAASLVEVLRPVPGGFTTASRWASTALVVMTAGIFVGRVVFTLFSFRLGERSIIGACLVSGLFAVPAAFATRPLLYLPAMFVTGICFSATWPAFFALAARHYPEERTFLSIGAIFFSLLGIWGATYLASAIGDADRLLPWALVASVAVAVPFALFLYVSPVGRGLGRPGHRKSS